MTKRFMLCAAIIVLAGLVSLGLAIPLLLISVILLMMCPFFIYGYMKEDPLRKVTTCCLWLAILFMVLHNKELSLLFFLVAIFAYPLRLMEDIGKVDSCMPFGRAMLMCVASSYALSCLAFSVTAAQSRAVPLLTLAFAGCSMLASFALLWRIISRQGRCMMRYANLCFWFVVLTVTLHVIACLWSKFPSQDEMSYVVKGNMWIPPQYEVMRVDGSLEKTGKELPLESFRKIPVEKTYAFLQEGLNGYPLVSFLGVDGGSNFSTSISPEFPPPRALFLPSEAFFSEGSIFLRYKTDGLTITIGYLFASIGILVPVVLVFMLWGHVVFSRGYVPGLLDIHPR